MPKPSKPLPPLSAKDIARFLAKVDKRGPNECWPWMACRISPHGYGQFGVSNGQRASAHRLAYFIHNAADPHPLMVCHTCDVPWCCNPAHLFKGTGQDNSDDKVAKGRQAVGASHGMAKLTTEQVQEIRELFAAGWTSPALAQKFGMGSYSAVWRIATGKIWKSVK